MSAPSKAALTRFRTQFAKRHGEGAITVPTLEVVSTGSPMLDYRLGCGGIPVGRIVHAWGLESTGKTTMAMNYAAQFQRRFPDKLVAWLDMEQTYLPSWAELHGVDPDRLDLTQPQSAEDVADMTKDFMESGLYSMVVLDSVGGMIARQEFEKDAEDAIVGIVAKIVTRTARIAAVRGNRHRCTLHVVNQVRANISKYGAATTYGGGFALRHASTISLQHKGLGAEGALTDRIAGETEVVGNRFSLFIEKNKLAPCRRTAEVTLLNQPSKYGPVGLDAMGEIFSLGILTNQFERGSWVTLPDGSRHNGEAKSKDHLREHPEVAEQIRRTALEKIAHTVITDPMKEGTA